MKVKELLYKLAMYNQQGFNESEIYFMYVGDSITIYDKDKFNIDVSASRAVAYASKQPELQVILSNKPEEINA